MRFFVIKFVYINKNLTFAALNCKRKGNIMLATAAVPTYDQVLVNIPHVEMKRFKAIMKALDYELVKRNELMRQLKRSSQVM